MFRAQNLVVLLLSGIFCKLSPENVTQTLLTYENYIKSSHDLEKTDKALLKNWSGIFKVNQINITTHYRLEMTRHKEHSFSHVNISQRWLDCLSVHDNDIKRSERVYFNSEKDCLTTATVADHDERKSVHQVAKEIRKWRKSYRYLANECHLNNPGNHDAAGSCLVQYMQRDHYDITFQRLIILKQRSIADVYVKMAYASNNLEECLKACLSQYLDTVRSVMNNLNICYEIKNKP